MEFPIIKSNTSADAPPVGVNHSSLGPLGSCTSPWRVRTHSVDHTRHDRWQHFALNSTHKIASRK